MLQGIKVREDSAGLDDSIWIPGMRLDLYFRDISQIRKHSFLLATEVTEVEFAAKLRFIADQIENDYLTYLTRI